ARAHDALDLAAQLQARDRVELALDLQHQPILSLDRLEGHLPSTPVQVPGRIGPSGPRVEFRERVSWMAPSAAPVQDATCQSQKRNTGTKGAGHPGGYLIVSCSALGMNFLNRSETRSPKRSRM